MKPRILIEIKGGCLYNLVTNGDLDVFLQDHDNHDEQPEPVPVDEVLSREAFTERVQPEPTHDHPA